MTAQLCISAPPPIERRSRAVDAEVAAADGHADPNKEDDRNRSVVILDSRVLAGEFLARGVATRCAWTDVTAVTSITEWRDQEKLHPPLAVILFNIGGRNFADQGLVNEARQLVCEFAPVPVVVLADSEDIHHMATALECGVRGYIPATVGIDVCINAIRLAIAGGAFVPAASFLATKDALHSSFNEARPLTPIFSPREVAVVEALRQGKANKIIAYDLNMCESTVKVHVRSIMKKLKATNRTEVAYKIHQLFGPNRRSG